MASVVDMSDVDHAGTGAARRRRERSHRAYLRYAQMSVARGRGRHLCLRLPGRRRQSRSVTWLPRGLLRLVIGSGGGARRGSTTPPSSPPTVLRARAEDEMVAKEQAELDQLVGDLAVKEGQLLAELAERDDAVRITRETWSSLSRVERTAVRLVHCQGEAPDVEGEERKRRRRRRRRTWLTTWQRWWHLSPCSCRSWSAAPHDVSSILSYVVREDRCWVLPEGVLWICWETTSGLFSYSASLGSTVDTCLASCLVYFYELPASGSR